MSNPNSQLFSELGFKPKYSKEQAWGTMRYESNPWCSPDANVLYTKFSYKLTSGTRKYAYASLQVNSILYVYNSSTPEQPLFRYFTVHLNQFKFSVYRQLNLGIPPTLIGHYSSYANALKACQS